MNRKIAVVLFALLVPAAVFAQQNEVGIFASYSMYDETVFSFEDLPEVEFTFEFEDGVGFGASYNRFWGPNISTELAYTAIHSDLSIGIGGPGVPDPESGEAGETEFRIWSGTLQWHLLDRGRVRPYLGAGIARIDGEGEATDETGNTVSQSFGSSTGWVANAGVNFEISPRFALALDAKYFPYSLEETGEDLEPGDEAVELDVNPLVISAGVRIRF